MNTRKLILTALVCGLVIIFAGGFKLFQVAGDDTKVEILGLRTPATLGDMTVSVVAIDASSEATLVTVTMAGVEIATGAAEGWRLLADGRVLGPLVQKETPNACVSVSATRSTTCVVAFLPIETTPTVAYLRAGDQQQWGES